MNKYYQLYLGSDTNQDVLFTLDKSYNTIDCPSPDFSISDYQRRNNQASKIYTHKTVSVTTQERIGTEKN